MAKKNTGTSVRIAQKTYQKTLLKKFGAQVFGALFIVLLVYVAFAATVIRVVPTTSAGFPLIKNNTFEGGIIEPNTQILARLDGQVVEDSLLANIKYSFLPQSDLAIVEVLAGPTGRVQWNKNGVLAVDGKAMEVAFPVDPERPYLKNEYVAVCVQGDCLRGAPVFIPAQSIYGVTLSKKSFRNAPDFTKVEEATKDPGRDAAGRLSEKAILDKISPLSEKLGGPKGYPPCAAREIYTSKVSNQGVEDLIAAMEAQEELVTPKVKRSKADDVSMDRLLDRIKGCMNESMKDGK